jgi:hypothetical protein
MTSNHLLSPPQGDKKPAARKKAVGKKKELVPPSNFITNSFVEMFADRKVDR